MHRQPISILLGLAALAAIVSTATPRGAVRSGQPKFERVYPLAPEEGVFAYARISPDGNRLAYASETRPGPGGATLSRIVRVVDLRTKKITYSEPGIDAYWSTDGTRIIFRSYLDGLDRVTIYHHDTGAITRDIAPAYLGDYYSWGVRDGRDLIQTIDGAYYYLNGDRGVMPAQMVTPCEGVGMGARPLMSKDGRRLSIFVRGRLMVRNLSDCKDIVDTGVGGAKADFSFDGRYIAFHMPKKELNGYDIAVVDLERRTIRTVTHLPGSSLFPSWTQDGRLSFRYDGEDYRGFMMASDVLAEPERPWPAATVTPASVAWHDVFPETPAPAHAVNVVTVWATWSAHSPDALLDLQSTGRSLTANGADVGVFMTTDLGSLRPDIDRMVQRYGIAVPAIPLAPRRFTLTEAQNQVPSTLLFKDGQLVDRKLGAQTSEQLKRWIADATH